MQYQQALKLWGRERIIATHRAERSALHRRRNAAAYVPPEIDLESVRVEMVFDPGSPDDGPVMDLPRAEILVTANGGEFSAPLDIDGMDFAALIGEIIDAAGGTITKHV